MSSQNSKLPPIIFAPPITSGVCQGTCHLQSLDDDYSLIRAEIRNRFPKKNFDYMLEYLALERFSYQSNNISIKESFVNSETLGRIETPVVFKDGMCQVNANHRFFYGDIFYGLEIAK